MLSVNLLPTEQKDEANRHQLKLIISSISYILAAGLLVIAVLLFYVTKVSQKSTIEDLKTDTDKALIQLQGEPDIDKLLTIQNQLTSIPQLHNSKAVSSRLFDYLDKIVPVDVTLTDINVGFAAPQQVVGGSGGAGGIEGDPGLEAGPPIDETLGFADQVEIRLTQTEESSGSQITISGITRDFKSLNTFVDVIKNAEFVAKASTDTADASLEETATDPELKRAFTNVKTDSASPQDEVTLSFALTFDYDPQLFDFTVEQIVFSVPSKITTVSEQERPTGLFIDDPFDDDDENGGL